MFSYDEHISVRDKQLARLASIDSENAALQTRFDQLKENNTSEVSITIAPTCSLLYILIL